MPEYDSNAPADNNLLYQDDRIDFYFGSSDDLVDRYFQAARKHEIDLIVRVTADCPLIQGKIIDEMLCEYLKNGYNGYMCNSALISDSRLPAYQ